MRLVSQAKSIGYLPEIDLQTTTPVWWKNISVRRAEDYPLAEQILYLASFLPNRSLQFFDLKIQDLKKGEHPCIPGWHLDSGPDKEAQYILMTAGVSRTEFALTELEVEYSANMKLFCHRINQLVEQPTKKLNDFEIVQYDNTTIHRGTPATELGRRLLIRVMETSRS